MSKVIGNNKNIIEMNKENGKHKVLIEVINKFEPILHDAEQDSDNNEIKSDDPTPLTNTNITNTTNITNEIIADDNQTEDTGWKTIKNKKPPRKKRDFQIEDERHSFNNKREINKNIIEEDENGENGSKLKLKHKWKVWVHLNDSAKWDEPSFDSDFFIIDSVATFLQFFNNFYKFNLKTYSFYIMKSLEDGSFIVPTWEHPLNRNGGTCSLRIDMIHGIELMPLLCILMVNGCLIVDMDQVNGISFNSKTNWALIKIWTKDKDVDISKMLPDAIINSYPSLCVKSKANTPEY